MLGFVQNWFAPKANPIGVDFGSDSLRLAQVQFTNGEYRLIAAASADVPPHVRHNPLARFDFFVDTTRDLLAQGNFRGRQAVLALPASNMHIQHLRMARMDDAETKKAIPWEARGKLPIEPSTALIRHLIAGEVYQDQEPKNEVIIMAAAKEFVNQFLAAAAKARLDVIGMNVEPKAVVDCFGHVYRRKIDAEATTLFLDIGLTGSRAVIARGDLVLFARGIAVGGEHFNTAVAHALRINLDAAKLLRLQLAATPPPSPAAAAGTVSGVTQISSMEQAQPLPGVPSEPGHRAQATAEPAHAQANGSIDPELASKAAAVEQACQGPLRKLVEELDFCRRYYESTFPAKPVDRIIFIGGEARQRMLCQQVARELALAAQLGDPLVRMNRISDLGIESGIDRRHPQPGWTVAVGLSLGPAHSEKPQAAMAASGREG